MNYSREALRDFESHKKILHDEIAEAREEVADYYSPQFEMVHLHTLAVPDREEKREEGTYL